MRLTISSISHVLSPFSGQTKHAIGQRLSQPHAREQNAIRLRRFQPYYIIAGIQSSGINLLFPPSSEAPDTLPTVSCFLFPFLNHTTTQQKVSTASYIFSAFAIRSSRNKSSLKNPNILAFVWVKPKS